jgi:hypothetical protein
MHCIELKNCLICPKTACFSGTKPLAKFLRLRDTGTFTRRVFAVAGVGRLRGSGQAHVFVFVEAPLSGYKKTTYFRQPIAAKMRLCGAKYPSDISTLT